MDDLYKNLQVDPRAESEVIRAAYYALARKYHPDVGGDLRRMVDFNAAWAVLGNPLLRSAYDAERGRPTPSSVTAERADAHGDNGQARGETPPRSRLDSSSILDFGAMRVGRSLRSSRKIRTTGVAGADPDRTPAGGRGESAPRVPAASRSPVGVGRGGPQSGGPIGERRERTSAGRQWFGRSRQRR